MDNVWLLLIAVCTSAITATIGLGGGLLLLAVMPGFVPTAVLIPVHGVAQLASNSSRALIALGSSRRAVDWHIVGLHGAGACVGAALGAPLVLRLPTAYLPVVLGLFVLLVTWVPLKNLRYRLPGGWFGLGAGQTALSMFVGAAGPLSAPLLLRAGLTRERLVGTHATMMTVMHGLKLLAYIAIGFSLREYAGLLVGLVVAVSLGSWIGTGLRRRIPEARFRHVFRWVLTLLALRMILGIGVG